MSPELFIFFSNAEATRKNLTFDNIITYFENVCKIT